MNSKIYIGKLMHIRFDPAKHSFEYPIYFYAFDLDELDSLSQSIRLFSSNQFNLVSLWDKDYLSGEGSIKNKLLQFLAPYLSVDGISRIDLITSARYFNYVFNPVNFYYCYKQNNEVKCILVEVNNTFKDRHIYILKTSMGNENTGICTYEHVKEFHVSPFNNMNGNYRFKLHYPGDSINISIDLFRNRKKILTAILTGKSRALTPSNLLKTVAYYPLSAALTMPRIIWQAGKLHYVKKLKVYSRPIPSHTMTIRSTPPSRSERINMKIVKSILNQTQKGQLILTLPNQKKWSFGTASTDRKTDITVHRHEFFNRIIKNGDIGLGEGYIHGDWSTSNLVDLLMFFIDNLEHLKKFGHISATLSNIWFFVRHQLNRNTRIGSRKNIQAHYDIGNDFFEAILDSKMMYSCGIFKSPDDQLEHAQSNKIYSIIKKARITKNDHVLEIGSGWGGFAIEAAKATGCRITTITLSNQQFEYTKERALKSGMDHLVSVKYCDYRDMEGSFDKIVSIEMLEAVGHQYFSTFFSTCERLLKPGGILVLQVITIPDQRYFQYKWSPDYIQTYIFPGGMLPSLTVLNKNMTRFSSFIVDHLENIGPHYARTLKLWHQNMNAKKEYLLKKGYDEEFLRKFQYYFAYCEAGFKSRMINTLQLVLTRQKNLELIAYDQQKIWSKCFTPANSSWKPSTTTANVFNSGKKASLSST